MTVGINSLMPREDSSCAGMPVERRPVMLVGFQRQANLGLGYLASYLVSQGFPVTVCDCELPADQILALAKTLNPVLIGFSLIFQFYVEQFRATIRHLRDNGINCHFTMGGHFPSLSYGETLNLIPELDSVVRFEGELTLLDLVDTLTRDRNWRDIPGLAWRDRGSIVESAMRHLIHDLDILPYPQRDFERDNSVLGRKAIPLLASRGCARTCSFCSIHMFYRAAPGKIVRTRKPAEVVKEMQFLHDNHGITIFLFQDDDFPLFGAVWRRWASEFVEQLHASGLVGRVIWKINCRADAVEPSLMAKLRDAGLYLVYMGLESGTDEGLRALHKQLTVEHNLRAVRILKELDMLFEYGFMLLDPSSSFDSVRANVQFLRAIIGDGSAAAIFCRMIPYDGTPIKDELAAAGRLRGDICNPDYDFLDPKLDSFYNELSDIVKIQGWTHSYGALSSQLNWAWNEVAVLQHLFPQLEDLGLYRASLRKLTAASNELLFRIIEDIADSHSHGHSHPWSAGLVETQCRVHEHSLLSQRNEFVLRHQTALLAALDEPIVRASA